MTEPTAVAGDSLTPEGPLTPPDIAEQFDPGRWEFTPGVAAVFEDHVRASVPHYEIIQDAVIQVSDWLLPAGALIADYGASTGTTVAGLLDRHPERDLRAMLYDEAPAMLAKATERLMGHVADGRVEVRPVGLPGDLAHRDADLSIMLFLLQFLPYRDRVTVLRDAHRASAPTGALLVAEKVRPVDSRWAEIANAVSHDWKSEHGIDAAAIRAKERALRGVLQPASLTANLAMIREAGWYAPEVLFRWHNWVLMGAYATPPDGAH